MEENNEVLSQTCYIVIFKVIDVEFFIFRLQCKMEQVYD